MPSEALLTAGLVLGGAGYLALVLYVWRYPAVAGRAGLLTVLASVFVWSTAYALEVSARSVTGAEIWSAVKYVGVVSMPPGLLSYAVEYTGRRAFSRRVAAALAVVPALTIVSLLVPATSDLIHVYGPDQQAQAAAQRVVVPDAGPLFWPHAAYNYGIAFFALGLVVVRLFRAGHAYRRQALAVLVASLGPLLANIAYNAGVFGRDAVDPVPFGFVVLAVVLVWGFFRMHLLDLRPVARDVAFEQMPDGVLALDAHDRVVEANAVAEELLGLSAGTLVGRDLASLSPRLAPLLGVDGRPQDVRLPTDRDVAVTVTPLLVGGRVNGRLVVLRDVTERQAVQRRLGELLTEQTRIADTLQSSLRPASLPEVDGLQLAVRSLPSTAGGYLSGDFYDVHRVLGGDWAFALGDVSGKGVEAAVLTSLARYTVRTLSAEGRAPVQVLEQLNRALLVDETAERFCTVVYLRIDSTDLLAVAGVDGLADSPGTVRCRIVLGGHPRPLLRRRAGLVEAVGAPGTALGLLPKVDVEEVTVELESGDVLLAYTDGVTEARCGGEQFGEERLAGVLADAAAGLRGRTGLSAAHLAAEAVAERVVDEVTRWAARRDDVAVLVIAVP